MQSRVSLRWMQRASARTSRPIAAAVLATPAAWRGWTACSALVAATQQPQPRLGVQQLWRVSRPFSSAAEEKAPSAVPAAAPAAAPSAAAAPSTPSGGASWREQHAREDREREERWSRHQQQQGGGGGGGGSSSRHSWHRALTAHERRALVAIVAANVWVMFMQMYAEDTAKAAAVATAKTGGPAPEPNELQLFLHRHFEASTYNVYSGRLYTLASATLRHGDLPHLIVNMAVLMMVAPGVLATVGLRSFAKVYIGAAVVAWGAELAFWDGILPGLMGKPRHPSPDAMHATLKEMNRAQDQKIDLSNNQQYNLADWRSGIGASPSVLALATAWAFLFHNTPLGKSPMGHVVRLVLGVAAVSGVADVFAKDPRQCAVVVHSAGAAVGAFWYWAVLRRYSKHATVLRQRAGDAMARAAGSARAPAPAAAAAPAHAVAVQTAPAAESADLRPVVPSAYVAPEIKPLQTAAPANENMRTTPPVNKKKRRHFSTSARAPAASALPAAPRVVCTPIGRHMHVMVQVQPRR